MMGTVVPEQLEGHRLKTPALEPQEDLKFPPPINFVFPTENKICNYFSKKFLLTLRKIHPDHTNGRPTIYRKEETTTVY